MKYVTSPALMAALLMSLQPALAAPASTWRIGDGPALPLRYIEATAILRLTPQIANAETYAPAALIERLYPSISPNPAAAVQPVANTGASIASKNGVFQQFSPRGNLSPSHLQEFAYIDAYTNIRENDQYFSFPSIRMSLAIPRFGNGFGGGYQPLQFGFRPAAFRFW